MEASTCADARYSRTPPSSGRSMSSLFPPPTVKQPIGGASRYPRTFASVGGWLRAKRARRLA
eukprot:4085528-Prymnesium_polylepis.1